MAHPLIPKLWLRADAETPWHEVRSVLSVLGQEYDVECRVFVERHDDATPGTLDQAAKAIREARTSYERSAPAARVLLGFDEPSDWLLDWLARFDVYYPRIAVDVLTYCSQRPADRIPNYVLGLQARFESHDLNYKTVIILDAPATAASDLEIVARELGDLHRNGSLRSKAAIEILHGGSASSELAPAILSALQANPDVLADSLDGPCGLISAVSRVAKQLQMQNLLKRLRVPFSHVPLVCGMGWVGKAIDREVAQHVSGCFYGVRRQAAVFDPTLAQCGSCHLLDVCSGCAVAAGLEPCGVCDFLRAAKSLLLDTPGMLTSLQRRDSSPRVLALDWDYIYDPLGVRGPRDVSPEQQVPDG